MAVYSQAYMMRCPQLKKCLEEMVVNELVNPSNATIFYVDAIRVSTSALLHFSHPFLSP